ncbi:MAG: SPOR domain-containing protein [Bacteroidaceae bacterium]|nr:SPOR domain-containing protein [Bacteroidaceae bacterium]
MKKLLLSFVLLFACTIANAQVKYTEEIQTVTPGQGRIVLHQSKAIADLVNAPAEKAVPVAVKSEKKASPASVKSPQVVDSLLADTVRVQPTGARVRMNGYRIQVYLGGNTRSGKSEALMMKERVKSLFIELPVYVGFLSPHWICRVGDFRTYEEASEYLHKMRETGRFDEAVIIKSKINVRE